MKESLDQFQESNKRSIRGTQKNRIRGFKRPEEIHRDPRRPKDPKETHRDQKRPLSQETRSPKEYHRDPRRPKETQGDPKRPKETQGDPNIFMDGHTHLISTSYLFSQTFSSFFCSAPILLV